MDYFRLGETMVAAEAQQLDRRQMLLLRYLNEAQIGDVEFSQLMEIQSQSYMNVNAEKHDAEEKTVFRSQKPTEKKITAMKTQLEIDTASTPFYSNLIARRSNYAPSDLRVPQLTPTPRRSRNHREPFQFRSNRALVSASMQPRNYEDVVTEKKSRPKHRSKSRKMHGRVPTQPYLPYLSPGKTQQTPELINEVLLSTQSKQIVLRLQRLNTLLRQLSFVTVQQLILVCRLVRYNRNECIFNHKKQTSIHGYLLITGSVVLKCTRYRNRLAMYQNSTLEEQNIVPCRYTHHSQRFDVGRSTSDNTVCLRISRSQWEIVRHRLLEQYCLHQDVKHFEASLRRNFCEKMSELNRAIYEIGD